MKKITLKPKPQVASPDEWVNAGARTESSPRGSERDGERGAEKATSGSADSQLQLEADTVAPVLMKRLTIDIPNDLHTRIKMQCAARGRKMADEIRVLLEERFRNEPNAD